jgi:hypothetical protein
MFIRMCYRGPDGHCLGHFCVYIYFKKSLHKLSIFSYALLLMRLVLLARFVALISPFLSILVPRMCVLYHNFIAYFLALSLRISLSRVIK